MPCDIYDNVAAMDEEATTTKAKTICAVDKTTVHQICSGQVIVNLATAVKELVENSLDAGAKKIDIHCIQHGSDSVEVSDDGSGIEPQNFEALTLKHHTSKISDFSDLATIETFGFRGEALSSLCALSLLSVTTKHRDEKFASELHFDANGRITSHKRAARPVGTSVTIKDIFKSMPVRRKEFERNLKKEFGKLVSVLQAYGLVSKGVRISCYNKTGSNRKLIFQTSGRPSIQGHVLDVFDSKQLDQLKPMELHKPDLQDLELSGLAKLADQPCPFELEGMMSKCPTGSGRSAPDRQFYYVNSRPCDYSRLSKLVNEVYRQYNKHQYPFVILNLKFPTDRVDVNVTPDKRQVFLQEEKLVLAWVKSSVLHTLGTNSVSYECNLSVFDSYRSNVPQDRTYTVDINTEGKHLTLKGLKEFANDNFDSPVPSNSKVKKRKSLPEKGSKSNKYYRSLSFGTSPVKEPHKEELQEVDEVNGDAANTIEPVILIEESGEKPERKVKVIDISLEKIKTSLNARKRANRENQHRKFLAKIAPDDSKTAEAELSKNIDKTDFLAMKIIGQFNLGFIIVQLRNDDLFIVDQHATDEKFQFEKLLKSDVLESQSMVVPLKLDLSMTNVSIIQDNLDLFKTNGFDFVFSEAGILLSKVPHYRNWTFGKDEVDELIFLLSEGDAGLSRFHRPSKVQTMLASRACRTSVMIGTALRKSEMRRIVEHMSEMEHPWNCPHGRPTMRHLTNLNLLASYRSQRSNPFSYKIPASPIIANK